MAESNSPDLTQMWMIQAQAIQLLVYLILLWMLVTPLYTYLQEWIRQRIRKHNEEVLRNLKNGDIIKFKRFIGIYYHFAIYAENSQVIHRGSCGGFFKNSKAKITIARFWRVAGGCKADRHNKFNVLEPYPDEKIMTRARSKVGEEGYNVLHKNCEHFVMWCRYGIEVSEQADNIKLILSNKPYSKDETEKLLLALGLSLNSLTSSKDSEAGKAGSLYNPNGPGSGNKEGSETDKREMPAFDSTDEQFGQSDIETFNKTNNSNWSGSGSNEREKTNTHGASDVDGSNEGTKTDKRGRQRAAGRKFLCAEPFTGSGTVEQFDQSDFEIFNKTTSNWPCSSGNDRANTNTLEASDVDGAGPLACVESSDAVERSAQLDIGTLKEMVALACVESPDAVERSAQLDIGTRKEMVALPSKVRRSHLDKYWCISTIQDSSTLGRDFNFGAQGRPRESQAHDAHSSRTFDESALYMCIQISPAPPSRVERFSQSNIETLEKMPRTVCISAQGHPRESQAHDARSSRTCDESALYTYGLCRPAPTLLPDYCRPCYSTQCVYEPMNQCQAPVSCTIM